MLRHEGSGFAKLLGDFALLLALGQFAADEIGNLAGGKVVALQVLDDLVGLVVVVVDERGDAALAGQF